MLLKRGCPPMSHIWGETAQNQQYGHKQNSRAECTARVQNTGRCWSSATLIWFAQWKHPAGYCSSLAYLYCHISFSDLPHVETNCESCLHWTGLTVTRQTQNKKVACWWILNVTLLKDTSSEILSAEIVYKYWRGSKPSLFYLASYARSYLIATICVLTFCVLSLGLHQYNHIKFCWHLFNALFHLIQKSHEKPSGCESFLWMGSG